MIARWPGKIQPASQTDLISAFWDVMPTVADLAGVQAPEQIDGISFLPTLLGQRNQKKHNYLYWEFHEQGGRQAIRKEDWKLVRYKVLDTVNITTELYNLRTDLEEKNNVAAAHPEVVKELLDQLKIIRDPNTDFPFIEKLH